MADTAALLEEIYFHGLGEFAYRNGLDLRGRIASPHGAAGASPTAVAGLHEHAAGAIGGGKDSLVAVEAIDPRHGATVLGRQFRR